MEIYDYILELEKRAKAASAAMNTASDETRRAVLLDLADRVGAASADILAANALDLAAAADNGVPTPMLDRLRLTDARLSGMAEAVRALAHLDDPVGGGKTWTTPAGLTITERRVPLGVVAMIFEARPNVTLDAAALCIRSGNAAVLRGGKEAVESSRAVCRVVGDALEAHDLPRDGVCLVERTERAGAEALMTIRGYVDVLIPRGGKGLIRNVVDNAKVPTIETGAGNCHIYVEKTADFDMARRIIENAKVQRPAVCNAAECLLCDRAVAAEFLPLFEADMQRCGVEIRADANCIGYFKHAVPAVPEDFDTEYDDLIISVKVVENVREAVDHINRHGTKHSESIITRDDAAAKYFTENIDAAVLYVNTSTRFTDGGEFGYGAEIGISTQKLHARGPMGLSALTTVKYLVTSSGAVRK